MLEAWETRPCFGIAKRQGVGKGVLAGGIDQGQLVGGAVGTGEQHRVDPGRLSCMLQRGEQGMLGSCVARKPGLISNLSLGVDPDVTAGKVT